MHSKPLDATRLHVRVARHEVACLSRRPPSGRLNERVEVSRERPQLGAQPQAHICRYLVVTAARSSTGGLHIK